MVASIKNLALITIQIAAFRLIREAGYTLVGVLRLPLPGSLVGMLILFGLLTSGLVRLQWIESAASLLVRHLPFFFIPIAVGLMVFGELMVHTGVAIFSTLMVSAAIGICVAGFASQALTRCSGGSTGEVAADII